ncbi:MAG: hypothetical protein HY306_06200 [Nitrosomonadales bacterium]|nr:hypothetical protein [Nitrosomonadales bacterium]
MKKDQRCSLMVVSIVLAVASQLSANVAQAGAGWGKTTNASNVPIPVQTYYANSPVGAVPAYDPVTGLPKPALDANGQPTGLPEFVDSGKALRKFVDTLPGFGAGNANDLGQYIPVAVPEHNWVNPVTGVATADDYYEIAAVEYSEKMHKDLPKATHLRGYVQLETAGNAATSNHVALTYPDGSPILNAAGQQVFAYDNPHHLGPIIQAQSGTVVRVKFTNYLPVGGNLFLPVDRTVTGAGTLGTDGKTYYTENRAEIHLVGGQSPWISAGSPHQWVAPAGEVAAYAAGAGRGPSAQNVPDMADPGAGSTTLYFPNNQSARFMFYQDRTSGLTRLNSYAGLEAGYVITDPAEQWLVDTGAIPADQIPLIIEDKTFVPNNIAQQDAKWIWGQPGDLWFPHVYETNQDPQSFDGTNPVGRWDYGPWFWPIFAATYQLPDTSFVPEAYHDTPVVNGTAYPTLTVDPKAYRLRILNASNDRFINLGFYKADGTLKVPQLDQNGNPVIRANGDPVIFENTEVKLVAAAPADVSGAPLTPVSTTANAPYEPNCLCQYPDLPQLQPNIAGFRAWPVDGRVGGAPDPMAVGPDFIAIGNDGGFLPNPVDVPSQPVTYETNRRSITVTNIYGYGMLLGPSERADTIVDFSAYAGQTLILYNDAPAPTPFNDQRVDYYTGDPDQTDIGGAYSTQPGYGPNTRTMMQIKVNVNPVAATGIFDARALLGALPAAYAASQPMPIVPEAAYNTAFGTNDADNYAHVATGSVAQPNLDFTASGNFTIDRVDVISSGGQLVVGTNNIVGNAVPGSGTGYDPANPPTVVFNDGNCLSAGATPAQAFATVDPKSHQVTAITLGTRGQATVPTYPGYTCAPLITFEAASGIGAQATVHTTASQSILVQAKAEQELFDAYGRYNSTGGVELPLTSGTTQTTVPLSYYDSPTDIIADGETQLWKLVDNGLWTNSMHFDFVDVQLVNRVGWDGTVKTPAANEVGWKDTLRLNPLEDVIIAMRAKRSPVPFGMPASSRLKDPMVAAGKPASGLAFMVDPGVVSLTTGKALLTATNDVTDYDNEYVWNSAILGHSEDDLMRPIVFHPTVAMPDTPTRLAFNGQTLSWFDATLPMNPNTRGNPKNEIGFKVERATYVIDKKTNSYVPGTYTVLGTAVANANRFVDPGYNYSDYSYRVTAYNAKGSAAASIDVWSPLAPPSALQVSIPAATGTPVVLSWVDNENRESGYTVEVSTDQGATYTALATVSSSKSYLAGISKGATVTYTATPTLGSVYTYRVRTIKTQASSANLLSSPLTVDADLSATTPAAPTGLAVAYTGGTTATLSWTASATAGVTGYIVQQSMDGGATWTQVGNMLAGNATNVTTAVENGNIYQYQVMAQIAKFNSPVTTANSAAAGPITLVTLPIAPVAPSSMTATLTSATSAALSWTPSATSGVTYVVQRKTNAGNFVALATLPAGTTSYTDATVVNRSTYTYQVAAVATNVAGSTSSTYTVSNSVSVNPPAAPAVPANLSATATSATSVALSWTASSTSGASYVIRRRVGGGAYAVLATVPADTTSYVDTTVGNGLSYTYQVAAVATNVIGSTSSAYVASNTVSLAPTRPSSVAAVAANTSVELSWVDSGITVSGYTIQRSVNGGAYAVLTTIGSTTSYSDTSVVAGSTYNYRVAAQSGTALSAYVTATRSAAPAVPTIGTTTAGAAGSNQLTLNWTDNSSDESGFTVQRSAGTGRSAATATYGPFTTIATPTVTANTTSYVDTGLTAGTFYRYRVMANGFLGNSANSGNSTGVKAP